ncbi:MAG TPA: HTH domain-containing protein [Symbiobacteriaceae bacterium]|nr:HTH domain-containing protein [Symbiobacteriaceae bacterium]
MNSAGSSTRERFLSLLLRHKAGLTIDELSEQLAISRNAVRQHLAALERDGLVAAGGVRRGVGRPSQVYLLTPLGAEQFPRQYSLLSGWILSATKALHGTEGTSLILKQIANGLAEQLAPRIAGGTLAEKAEAVADVLTELGYEAATEQGDSGPAITAINCVYHHLAAEYPEVCELDIRLIEQLTGARVEHTECMVRGGQSCRFRLLGANQESR